jgi:hypothetical protein
VLRYTEIAMKWAILIRVSHVVVLIFLASISCLPHGLVFAIAQVTDIKPIASIRWNDIPEFRDASEIGDPSEMKLAFIDDDHLALGVLFESLPDMSASRDFRNTIVGNAVVAILNVKNGDSENARTWSGMKGTPAFGGRLTLQSTQQGNCLVGLGDRLYLLSRTLKQIAERTLPLNRVENNGYPFQDTWSLLVSPARNTGLLMQAGPDLAVKNHWIDLRTLDDESVKPAPKYSLASLANDAVVIFNENSADGNKVQIQLRGLPPRPLCAACVGAVSTAFGKDFVLLATKPAASYIVATTAGEILMRETRGQTVETLRGGVGASTANRAAFLYGHVSDMKGSTHITVLDADEKREIWNYDLSEEPERIGNIGLKFRTPVLAISPDGHKLAVLVSGQVQVFKIN